MLSREIDPFAGVIEMGGDIQSGCFSRHRAVAQGYYQARGESFERLDISFPEVRKDHWMQHYGGPPVHRAHVHEAVAFSGSTTQAQGSRSGRELPQEIVEASWGTPGRDTDAISRKTRDRALLAISACEPPPSLRASDLNWERFVS